MVGAIDSCPSCASCRMRTAATRAHVRRCVGRAALACFVHCVRVQLCTVLLLLLIVDSGATQRATAGPLHSAHTRTKKKFTDIRIARALSPHQSLPDPPSPPLLSLYLPRNPSLPTNPFGKVILGRGASDIYFPNVRAHVHPVMRGLATRVQVHTGAGEVRGHHQSQSQ